MNNKLKAILGTLTTVLLFSFALFVLHKELSTYKYSEIIHEFTNIKKSKVLNAILLTISSYLVLTLYDVIAITYIGRKLPYRRVSLASFVGYTFSHNLGFSMLTGGAARFRLFSLWGLTPIEITQAIAYSGIVFWLGFGFVTGLFMLFYPPALPASVLHLPLSLNFLGIILLAISLFIFYSWVLKKKVIHIKDWEFSPPKLNIFLAGILVSSIDWILAAAVTFSLLPENKISFLHFVGIFQLSQVIGLISNVPGGLGVFESLVLIFFDSKVENNALVGALIAYRIIYYLLPLSISLILFISHELLHHFKLFASVTDRMHRQISSSVPTVLAVLTFAGGGILLFSSATPAIEERLIWLRDIFPLLFLEISHFTGSIIGVSLLILSRGLFLRLNAAYWLSLILTSLGAIVSLIKGFDYEEAVILLTILYLLLTSKKYFYRKTKILDETFSFTWFLSTALVLVTAVWLVFFRYKHVEYSHDLWWRVSLRSDAPRSLRATLGAFCLLLGFGIKKLLTPANAKINLSPNDDLQIVKELLPKIPQTYASLSLLGDKQFIFSATKKSFIMFAAEGRSWISLGDPLGEEKDFSELIWQFREKSDEVAADCVFYQVSSRHLPLYIDTGLDLLKLGEEAVVDLRTFNLDGKRKSSLRHSRNKVGNENWRLEICPPSMFSELSPKLKEISASWLATKNIREKSFSLGYYHEKYLENFAFALIKRDQEIVAFANIWEGDGKYELSVDLMRHSQSAPNGIMDFLFIELMLWGKAQGYQRFNLGMAPFSGLDSHQLAPLWTKIGRILYKHGERYYNFQGLRNYKEKFEPTWEPKYLAAPGGLNLARVMKNVASLISNGISGVVSN